MGSLLSEFQAVADKIGSYFSDFAILYGKIPDFGCPKLSGACAPGSPDAPMEAIYGFSGRYYENLRA